MSWSALPAHGLRIVGLLVAFWLAASWTAEQQTFHPRHYRQAVLDFLATYLD